MDFINKEEFGAEMMVGGGLLGAAGSILGGIESERQYKQAAKARGRQAEDVTRRVGRLGVVGGQKMTDLIREGSEARGALVAQQAHAGVSGPSVTTQRRRLGGRYREAGRRLGEEIGFAKGTLERQRRELLEEREELKRRGRAARIASYWDAGASITRGVGMGMLFG